MSSGSERRLEARSARRRSGRRLPERPPDPAALVEPAPPSFPRHPTEDARVDDFLTGRFGRGAGGTSVVPLSGDASTRRYYRLVRGGETTVLALYPEPFEPDTLPFLIVRKLMAGWGLPVPRVLDVEGPLGVVVQEDLGDLTLQEALRGAGAARRTELYRQALDQLVVLQREAARASQRAGCFQIAFDFEKLSWELHFFWKHFLEAYRKRDLSVEDRAMIADGFHRLCAEIASWPRVLTHRDFHSRNLMCHQGALYWIDFQDARMGPATYDLASLLRDSYMDFSEQQVEALIAFFLARRNASKADDADFRRRFDLMALQRNLKALGTFGYQTIWRGNTVYIQYIPRTLNYVRANLERYARFGRLRELLAAHLEELRQ